MNGKRFTLILFFALVMSLVVLANTACNGPKTETSNQNVNKAQNGEKKEAYTKDDPNPNSFSTKTYQKMNEAEQNKFVAQKADEFLQKLGFDKSEKVNGKGLELVKPYVDAYAKRLDKESKDTCGFGDNLSAMLKRGGEVSKAVTEGFKAENIPPQAGIYIVMIESEFCPCLQSPTGPLGMFQLTRANGKKFGLEVKRDASPTNPDQRCEVKPASRAAAKYLESLQEKAGTDGAIKTFFAISKYNSGETELELKEEIKKSPDSQESVWLLLTDKKEPKKGENLKYLPKFIAAGIVGENAKFFGVDISPLSQVK